MVHTTSRGRVATIFGLSLALLVSFCFSGCGQRDPQTTKSAAESAPVVQDADATNRLSSAPGGTDQDVSKRNIGSLSPADLGDTVRIRGEVIQQCPAAGCWFRVQDASGEMFVDLNPAGLKLTEDRVGQQATVEGRVAKQGGGLKLEAQSVAFADGR